MKKKFWLDKRKEKKNENQDIKISALCHQNHDQVFPIYLLFLSTFAMPSLMIYAWKKSTQSSIKNIPSSSHPYPYSLICPYLWLSFLQTPIPIHFWPRTLASSRYFFPPNSWHIPAQIPKISFLNFLTCFGSRFKKKNPSLFWLFLLFIGGFQQNNYYLLHKHPRVAIFFLCYC